MKSRFSSSAVRIATLAILSSALAVPMAASAEEQKVKPLRVCDYENGSSKTGPLDVVLLLDNSKSLNTKKKNSATDPYNKRFGAIGDLLTSFNELAQDTKDQGGAVTQEGLDINFGVVSFGSRAVEQIPLQVLGDPDATLEEIKRKVPVSAQEPETDYLKALNKAVSILRSRPENNCKFLVWFTDGQFESKEIPTDDEKRTEKVNKQVEELRVGVCGPKGLANQIHELRINTFVLVLKPSVTGKRLEASYGAMQAVTGSTVIPPGIKSDSNLCGDPGSRDHLGDVLVAEDAASIARKIPTIGNSIDGWTTVRVCPLGGSDTELPPMPAARHLKNIAFTAYENGAEIKDLDDSLIVDSQGESHEVVEFLKPLSSRSQYEKRFTFNSEANTRLTQGWKFSISDGEIGWCVQLLHRKFSVEFTDNPNAIVQEVSSGNLLTKDDLDGLTYKIDGATESITRDEARNESRKIVAYLEIDPSGEIFKSPIPVPVRQLKVPSIDCGEYEQFEFSEFGTNMPENRFLTSSCVVNTGNSSLGDITINVDDGPSLQTEKCAAELTIAETAVGELWTSDVKTSTSLVHKKGEKTLHAILSFSNREAKCSSDTDSKIVFVYGTDIATLDVPVVVNVDLKKVPNKWLVFLLTAFMFLLVIFLNLGLMRLLMRKSARISKFGVDAYEVPVVVQKAVDGRLEIRLQDGSSPIAHQFEVEKKIAMRVSPDGRTASLSGGSLSKLRVVLPPIYRPFGDAVMRIESSKTALYWQQSMKGDGLSPQTKMGVILHSPAQDGDRVTAMALFLLSSVGPDRQAYVRDVLSNKTSVALQNLLDSTDWFLKDSVGGGKGQGRPSAPPRGVVSQPGDASTQGNSGVGSFPVPPPQPPQPPPPRL